MKYLILILLFFKIQYAFCQDDSVQLSDYRGEYISMISLIATPEKYNNKKIMVDGYWVNDFENTALYLHEEYYKIGIDKNSISTVFPKIFFTKYDLKPNDFRCKYVIITGIFKNSGSVINSGIIKVTSIRPLYIFRE